MRSGFLPARVVHLHPTRVCNLACLHCYSTSGPNARGALDVDLLIDVLGALKGEGYEVLSLAGGEPLVYRALDRLVAAAAGQGYRVHLVTNGLLLSSQRLEALRDFLHFVAVSLDGAELTHNLVRGRTDAFAKANAALEVLAASSIPFAVAFGVSRRSLPDVPWAYDRACELGATLLHLRPLVAHGRGAELVESEWMLDAADCARLAVLGAVLDGAVGERPRVQVDLTLATDLRAEARPLDARRESAELTEARVPLSEFVNPLVIEDTGRCVAFTHGIHPSFTIAELAGDWRSSLVRARTRARAPVAQLLDAAFATLNVAPAAFVDWFAHLTQVSHAIGPTLQEHRVIAPP